MVRSDENSLGLIGSMSLQGTLNRSILLLKIKTFVLFDFSPKLILNLLDVGGGVVGKIKTTATTGPTRRALSTINKNITEAPSYPYAVNKRSVSERDGICNKPPVHRPVTRKFAAQLADHKPHIRDEETKKPDSVSSEEPETIIIDVDESDKEGGDSNEPMFVQHTEAMLEEIEQMVYIFPNHSLLCLWKC
jgi:cyclin B